MLTLSTGKNGSGLTISVFPEKGGSLGCFTLRRGAEKIELMQCVDPEQKQWSMFFCIPWFARVMGAQMHWLGQDFALRHPFNPEFAIHGITRHLPFAVADEGDDWVDLGCEFRDGDLGMHFMVPFATRIQLRLASDEHNHTLTIVKSVRNLGEIEAPFTMADHPFINKRLDGGSELPVLSFSADGYLPVREDVLVPTGKMSTDVSERGCAAVPDVFRNGAVLDPRFWTESCHPRWSGIASAVWRDSNVTLIVQGDEKSRFLQLWGPPDQKQVRGKLRSDGRPVFGIEPITGPADGVRLFNEGSKYHGVTIVQPGEEFATTTAYTVKV